MITEVSQTGITVHGNDLNCMIRNLRFGDVVYLMMTGKLPDDRKGRVIEALLIAFCDFGTAPPSTTATRLAASCGASLQSAVIAGLACMGEHHATVTACARMLSEHNSWKSKPIIPGLGHPVFKSDDPRIQAVAEVCHHSGIITHHLFRLAEIRDYIFSNTGKFLPINMAGATAAIMLDIGIQPVFGDAFFILGRTIGLIAHAAEQYNDPQKCKILWPHSQ